MNITIEEVAENLNLDTKHPLVIENYKLLVIKEKGIYIKQGNHFFTKEDLKIMKENPTSSFGLLEEIEDLEMNKRNFKAAFSRKVDLETAYNNSK